MASSSNKPQHKPGIGLVVVGDEQTHAGLRVLTHHLQYLLGRKSEPAMRQVHAIATQKRSASCCNLHRLLRNSTGVAVLKEIMDKQKQQQADDVSVLKLDDSSFVTYVDVLGKLQER